MRKILTIVGLIALAILPMLFVQMWRVRAAGEAAMYAPAYARYRTVPSGTIIQAMVIGGIPEMAIVGDPVVALVLRPVTLGGEVVIPAGSQLKGQLEQVASTDGVADARVRMTSLLVNHRTLPIETEPAIVTGEVRSDEEALSTALKALVSGSVGAALGAASGDRDLIPRGVVESARAIESDITGTPIRVKLTRNVILQV
jgi:hypothetical protein